jgi:Flp pilus assembly protein TadG
VTAEFAAVIPAIVLVLAVALATMQLAGAQLRLQAAAADAARMLGRGDGAGSAQSAVARAVVGASLSRHDRGDLVCVDARAPVRLGVLPGLTLRASACALDDG